MPNRRLQAAALRLIADRVERGERALSPAIEEAIARELEGHPDEAREIEALEELPAWQRALLDERLAALDTNLGAKPWREALEELRAELRRV